MFQKLTFCSAFIPKATEDFLTIIWQDLTFIFVVSLHLITGQLTKQSNKYFIWYIDNLIQSQQIHGLDISFCQLKKIMRSQVIVEENMTYNQLMCEKFKIFAGDLHSCYN